MLDWILLVLQLFTSPVQTIVIIVIVVLIFVGINRFANRSTSSVPLDAAPEIILRDRLKFADEDLQRNRSATISPKQIKRIRNEFLILLIIHTAAIVFLGFAIAKFFGDAKKFWGDMFICGVDLILIGVLSYFGVLFLRMAALQLWGYVKDLRTKRALALLTPLVFEEYEGEYMGFKYHPHSYKFIINVPRRRKPLTLHVGFMSEEVGYQVQKLRNQPALVYIAPNAQKLLSFELVETESAENNVSEPLIPKKIAREAEQKTTKKPSPMKKRVTSKSTIKKDKKPVRRKTAS